MAMDMDSGIMRMLAEGEGAKVNEQLFEVGEYIQIKGAIAELRKIAPQEIKKE